MKAQLISTHSTTHLLAHQGPPSLGDLAARQHARTTACGRKVVGFTGEHVAGDLYIPCGNCRRTALYRETARKVWEHERHAQIAQAEAYVTTRFFPPLPREYGALAVEAVERVNDGDPYYEIEVGHLPAVPREADAHGFVTAARLVSVLRLEHLIDDEAADLAYLEI